MFPKSNLPPQSMVMLNENDDHLVQQQTLFAKPIDHGQQYNDPPIYQPLPQRNNQFRARHQSQLRPDQLGNRLGPRAFGDRSMSRDVVGRDVSPQRQGQSIGVPNYGDNSRMGQQYNSNRPQSNSGSFNNPRMRDRSTGSQRPGDYDLKKPAKNAWGALESTNYDSYEKQQTLNSQMNQPMPMMDQRRG